MQTPKPTWQKLGSRVRVCLLGLVLPYSESSQSAPYEQIEEIRPAGHELPTHCVQTLVLLMSLILGPAWAMVRVFQVSRVAFEQGSHMISASSSHEGLIFIFRLLVAVSACRNPQDSGERVRAGPDYVRVWRLSQAGLGLAWARSKGP